MHSVPALLFVLFVAQPSRAEVECPAEAPVQETIEYEELWRTDAYSDEYLMGNITSGTMDDDGNLYLLDQQLQEVFLFDADGNFVDIVVREGEGPGEISQVWNIAWWPPSSLILPQAFPPRVVRVALDGTPQDELRVYLNPEDESPVSTTVFSACGDHAVVGGSVFTFGGGESERRQWLGVIGRDGIVRHKLGERLTPLSSNPLEQEFDELKEFWEWARWAVTSSGRIFRAPQRDAYVVEEYDLDGKLVATWRRATELRKRTEEELEELRDSRSFIFNGEKAEIEHKLSDVDPPIETIQAHGNEVWLGLDREPGAPGHSLVAVHSLDGTLLAERLLDIPHDPKNDVVIVMDGVHAIVIENGIGARAVQLSRFSGDEVDEELNAEPIEVVLYRVKG